MCGIAGIWGSVTVERLKAMADSLRHRGPDDEGYWTSPEAGIGLAHRRLSIIDVGGGRQPISNEDGRIITIFNGEIYNYRELREDLLAHGHHFKTQSDTEVIVHLYEECGTDVATKLRGMFAIAIWDDAQRQLVLIRDRVGKKPLYYSDARGEFVFASEIKGIVAGSQAPFALDEQAVADYLTWAAVPAPSTIYREVRSAKPGELMVIRDRRVAQREIYWKPQMLPKIQLPRKEAVDRIDDLLREAVRLRLRSDVPVGCFLSGGIDSGIVTAMAAQEHSGPLTTITIGFEDDAMDERPLAKLVAQRYGTDHQEVVVRPDVVNDLTQIVWNYDQPFGDASAIPSFYVAQAARRHVKVVLNGDGGDELLAGYRRYVAARINGLMLWADRPACRPVWQLLSRLLPVPRAFRSPYAFAHRWVRGMGLDPVSRYLAWTVDGLDERGLRALCRVNGNDPHGCWLDRVERSDRFVRTALDGLRDCGLVDRMLGVDSATILPDDLLVKMDIATMANGLEARSPLLDHVLIDAVTAYPETVKLSGFQTKPLLRELGRRYVPEAVRKAPKRGFEVPLVRWLRGELRGLCEDVVLSRDGLLADLFDRSALERLVREKDGLDPARWSRRLWSLLMLGMWDRVVNKTRAVPASIRGVREMG
ncbi:MAG: asparagine synthase (glutamine-hydrolyzing) [Phycisphaerae bacterium]